MQKPLLTRRGLVSYVDHVAAGCHFDKGAIELVRKKCDDFLALLLYEATTEKMLSLMMTEAASTTALTDAPKAKSGSTFLQFHKQFFLTAADINTTLTRIRELEFQSWAVDQGKLEGGLATFSINTKATMSRDLSKAEEKVVVGAYKTAIETSCPPSVVGVVCSIKKGFARRVSTKPYYELDKEDPAADQYATCLRVTYSLTAEFTVSVAQEATLRASVSQRGFVQKVVGKLVEAEGVTRSNGGIKLNPHDITVGAPSIELQSKAGSYFCCPLRQKRIRLNPVLLAPPSPRSENEDDQTMHITRLSSWLREPDGHL